MSGLVIFGSCAVPVFIHATQPGHPSWVGPMNTGLPTLGTGIDMYASLIGSDLHWHKHYKGNELPQNTLSRLCANLLISSCNSG